MQIFVDHIIPQWILLIIFDKKKMDQIRNEIQILLSKNNLVYAEKIVEKQYHIDAAFWNKFGAQGKKFSIRDAGYHLPFLAESILADDPKIFEDYIVWVKVLFQGLNFPDSKMIQTLECTRDILFAEMPSEMAALIGPFIDAGIEQMLAPMIVIDSYIDESTDLGKLAKNYNTVLLNGDRKSASNLILNAVKEGVKIEDLYIEVFQKSQYELGRLWLSNKISVAKEHFCSAATQMIMSQLYPYIFSSERIGKKFVGATIGGELHEIGIRMVADFFEMRGWDTYYLGANAPATTILKAVEENNADLIGLSIAMPYHRTLLAETISDIRKSTVGKDIKILIGGAAFNQKTDYHYFGADGFAPSALKAIDVANKLFEIKTDVN